MAAIASTNSAWRAAGTRTRVWATHAWPLFMSPATFTPAAATVGSASSSTIAADLPPSSRLTRLRSWPQRAATWRPAAVEPVNATLSIPGWATSSSPTSRPPGRMLTTPGGRPIPSMTSASSRASSGVSPAGLMTMEHPASRAGASFVAIRNCGMFHGTIAATTPADSLRTITSSPNAPVRTASHG